MTTPNPTHSSLISKVLWVPGMVHQGLSGLANKVRKVRRVHIFVYDQAPKYEDTIRRIEEHQAVVHKLNEKLAHEKDKTASWKERSYHFEKNFEDVCRELQDKRKELEKAQAKAHTLQLHALNQAQSGWRFEDDSKVHDALESLHSNIRQWAHRYSVRSMSEVHERGDMTFYSLTHDLEGIAKFPSVESLEGMKCPFLLVAEMLSRHLMLHIFNRPFFPLSNLDQRQGTSHCCHNLEDIYQRLYEADKPEIHYIRARLFRSFFPASEFGRWKSSLVRRRSVETLCKKIAAEFRNQRSVVLLSNPKLSKTTEEPTEAQFLDELYQIVFAACLIKIHLSTQRILYEWLPMSNFLDQQFQARSDFVKADQRNKLEDEEDGRCDGKAIRIIRSPLVIARGNGSGEDYDKTRTICRAIVWIEDSEDK
ncbi:hypothetical protein IWZ01DRAFT_571371 [Phyllosticta capitalensis]